MLGEIVRWRGVVITILMFARAGTKRFKECQISSSRLQNLMAGSGTAISGLCTDALSFSAA